MESVGKCAKEYVDKIVKWAASFEGMDEACIVHKRDHIFGLLRVPRPLARNVAEFAMLGGGNVFQLSVQLGVIEAFNGNDGNLAVLIVCADLFNQLAVVPCEVLGGCFEHC